ncbi:MAG: DUF4922 domain-containing protein [Bacteroides sp.]|nr:DUF4922 domain-containing protein [Bacteroides sp.]
MNHPIHSFFIRQIMKWPVAAENFKTIRETLHRGHRETIVSADEWKIEKMYVNHRRDSITAKTDAASIAARKCFLCKDNRPQCQMSMPWRDKFEILINPYPLSSLHLTIASVRHEPQAIGDRITDMAILSRLLYDQCVFYNGPRCGASAPDHFHFQAVLAKDFPNMRNDIPKEWIITETIAGSNEEAVLSVCTASPYPVFIIESTDNVTAEGNNALKSLFGKLMNALSTLTQGSREEPPVNIAVIYDCKTNINTFFIIPRSKHRPACYGTENGKILISPATIEMFGTIVCSRHEDYLKLDGYKALDILREVAISPVETGKVINILKSGTVDHKDASKSVSHNNQKS